MRATIRAALGASVATILGLAVAATPAAAAVAAVPGCVTTNPTNQYFNADTTPIQNENDTYIENTFTAARAAEGCNAPLVLPAGYDAMTPQQQVVWLINNEREIRGLPDLTPDTTLEQQIAYNHSLEEATYNYQGHYSPINFPQSSPNGDPLSREDIAPLTTSWIRGEVIQWGSTAADAVLFWIYGDGPTWPHRGLLLSNYGPGYIGVGAVVDGAAPNYYWTVDLSEPLGAGYSILTPASYTPPPTADTGAPVMGPVSYANGTATVTGVADSPSNVNDTAVGPNCSATASGPSLSPAGIDGIGWTATTNTNAGGGDAVANAFDGNLATRFSSDEPQAAGQQLTVNLGVPQSIDELQLQSPNSPNDYARGFTVSTSVDGTNWTPEVTCAGTSTPETVSFPATQAQYVQITLTAGDPTWWWSIDELNLYGPAPGALVPGITGVVFYTNSINNDGFNPPFNTVSATQTSPGTWSAPITVNAGDVLHAVAVDGSGNFTDMTLAQPAMALTAGNNTMALPAATAATTAQAQARTATAGQVLSAPGSAAALVASVDRQAGRRIAKSVRVYVNGHWVTYIPGKSANFALYVGEGVVLRLSGRVHWRPPAGDQRYAPSEIHLHRGWNFVAVPYPTTGMTCHSVRLELARSHDKMLQITVGPDPEHGVFMKPNKHGQWGNDLKKHIPYDKGFWIHDTGSATWSPSPTGYTVPAVGTQG